LLLILFWHEIGIEFILLHVQHSLTHLFFLLFFRHEFLEIHLNEPKDAPHRNVVEEFVALERLVILCEFFHRENDSAYRTLEDSTRSVHDPLIALWLKELVAATRELLERAAVAVLVHCHRDRRVFIHQELHAGLSFVGLDWGGFTEMAHEHQLQSLHGAEDLCLLQ